MKETKLCIVGPPDSGKTSWFSPFQGKGDFFASCLIISLIVDEDSVFKSLIDCRK